MNSTPDCSEAGKKTVNESLIQRAASIIRSGQRLTAFTGAGMSKESGIPTYREPQEGIWANYDPMELATPEGFAKNPKRVWDWNEARRSMMQKAEPNPGHIALAQIGQHFPDTVVVTQNIDNLHERAGSKQVIHLHGSIFKHRCADDCLGNGTPVDISTLDYDSENGPPKCPHCGALVRPSVVWFGERLPRGPASDAFNVLTQTDVLLVIGLSGAITYGMPDIVKENGGKIIEINPGLTAITGMADVWLPAPSGQALPAIVQALDITGSEK
jgi:NAD-dependent deacetylase